MTTAAVTYEEIEQQGARALALKSQDMVGGGGNILDHATREAARALHMLRRNCPMSLVKERAGAVAHTLCNAGFAAHDAGNDTRAVNLLRDAVSVAGDAEDWSLTARAYGQLGRQQLNSGHADTAFTWTEEALKAPSGALTASERAMLLGLQARALAASGRRSKAERVIGLARIHWADWMGLRRTEREQVMRDRPWAAWYDVAHLWGDIGAAWKELLKQDHSVAFETSGAYEQAALCHAQTEATNDRSAALVVCSHATVEVTHGDVERGIQLGRRALLIGEGVSSGRLKRNYIGLHDALVLQSSTDGAGVLMEQLRHAINN